MFGTLIAQAHDTATRTAKNAALGAGAAICMAVGIGFLTLAAWLVLITIVPPSHAALILGLGYFGAGLLLFGIISLRNRAYRRARAQAALRQAEAQPGTPQTLLQMITAFTTGIQAGRKARF